MQSKQLLFDLEELLTLPDALSPSGSVFQALDPLAWIVSRSFLIELGTASAQGREERTMLSEPSNVDTGSHYVT